MRPFAKVNSPSSTLAPRNSHAGVVALMTVIILGAVMLIVGISASFIGQTDVISIGQSDRGHQARELAHACAEEAMIRVKMNESYSGGTVPVGADTCMVTVSGSGSTRTVTASATTGDFTKTVRVTIAKRQNNAANARAWGVTVWEEL